MTGKFIEGACELLLIPDSPDSAVPEAPYGRKRRVTYTWCDENKYFELLPNDIDNAKGQVIIQSSFIALWRLGLLLPYIKAAIERGVAVCILLQKPDDWDNRFNEFIPKSSRDKIDVHEKAAAQLREVGAHVTLLDKVHRKFAVIDESIIWFGSLNTMSQRVTGEEMTRWVADPEVIIANMIFRKFSPCDVCTYSLPVFSKSESNNLEQLGKVLVRRRSYLGLSQDTLAESTGVRQKQVSRWERGIENLKMRNLQKWIGGLRMELVPVPWFLVGAVIKFIRDRYPQY